MYLRKPDIQQISSPLQAKNEITMKIDKVSITIQNIGREK